MSIRRLVLVHLLLALIAGFSLYDIATAREHWPFSSYTMFSRARMSANVRQLRLYGVVQTGGEISLHDRRYLWPFDSSRIAHSFRRLGRETNANELIDRALKDCLHRYERRRLQGGHDGPPLVKLRLYDVYWRTDPQASDADRPMARKLDHEVNLESEAKF